MSKTTRIVATAIPHGSFLPAPEGLQVSVALSPQLFTRGHRVRLGRDYFEVFNWPLYRRFFEKAVHFRAFAFGTDWKQAGSTQLLTTHKPRHYPHDLALWQQMLPPDTPVSHWEKSDLPYKLAQALTGSVLDERVRRALAGAVQQYFATAPAGASAQELASFETQINELAGLPTASLLAHPYLTSATHERGFALVRQELERLYNDNRAYLENLLLRLDLASVAERNIVETTEFHKRFSAYGQHPELLRRTGWLWDYTIEPEKNKSAFEILESWATAKHRVFIAVDSRPFDLSNADGVDKYPSVFSSLEKLGYQDAATPGESLLSQVLDPTAKPSGSGPWPAYTTSSHQAFWLAFLNELDVNFPLTAVELQSPTSWRVAGWPGKKSSDAVAPRESLFGQFEDYVVVSNDHFQVQSRLVDRAQLFRRVENIVLAQREAPPARADTGAALVSTLSATAQLPPLPTGQSGGYVANGITLLITNTLTTLKTVLANDPSTQRSSVLGEAPVPAQPPAPTATSPASTSTVSIADLLANAAIVYQHNVQNGYRVDVVALNCEQQLLPGSLCSRDETYHTRDGVLGVDELEGWLSEPAQLGQNGRLYVDEELFHWNDWSLAVSFERNCNPLPDDHLRIETTAAAGSLVPLRFRWTYSFALRPVDICGQSAPPIRQRLKPGGDWAPMANDFRGFLQTGTSTCILPTFRSAKTPAQPATIATLFTPPILHQRVDGVHQPQLFLYANNPRRWDQHPDPSGKGPPHEHLMTLVVRSLYEGGRLVPEGPAAAPADDVRMLAPPRISLALLLQHGVLDDQLRHADPATQQTLMRELVTWDAVHPPTEDFRRIGDRETLDYLADPLADGFVITLDGHPYDIPLRYAPQPRNPSFSWRYKYYHRLRLRATVPPPLPDQAASLVFTYDPGQRQPTETLLELRQGFMQEISLSCLLPEKFGGAPTAGLFMLGITQAYGSPLSGQASWDGPVPVAPNQPPVTLIHAVEKPCLLYTTYRNRAASAPDCVLVGAARRFRWATDLATPDNFHPEVPCSLLEVGDRAPQATTLDFEVEFGQFPVLTSETYRLHAFTVALVCDRRTELGYRVELSQRLIQSGLAPVRRGAGPTDAAREQDVRFSGLRHTFPDTRHYRVAHAIEAVSKFSAYFKDRLALAAPPASPAEQLCRYLDANAVGGYTMLSAAALEAELSAMALHPRPACPPGYTPPAYARPTYDHPYDDQALARRFFDNPAGLARPALLSVPSTARPQPPTIAQIVPLLEWECSGTATAAAGQRVERRCRAFRIYFEGDWYSSGWGEQVAVLFRPPGPENLGPDWAGPPFSSANSLRFSELTADYQELSLSQLSSQLGSDPISTTEPVGSLIDNSFFQDKHGVAKPVQTVLIADLEWDKPTYASPGPGPERLRDLALSYVCYPVCFAPARQLNDEAGYTAAAADYRFEEGRFFVDVHCNPASLQSEYFPFLRFAIARYQPHSIQPLAAGAASPSQRFCFSKIVVTDFCQPPPHRVITLRQETPRPPEKSATVTITWPAAANPTKQYQLPQRYTNQLACFADPDADPPAHPSPTTSPATSPTHRPLPIRDDTAAPDTASQASAKSAQWVELHDLPLRGDTVTLAPAFLTSERPVLVIAEYECYDNQALPPLSPQDRNPRLDPRYRLVFSYVHRLTS